MPHGHCYQWRPELVWLHAGSDAVVFLCYLTIPVAMLFIAQRRNDVPFRGIFLAFVCFILSCGLGHLLEVVTLWQPYYWVSGGAKAVTALSSAVTVVLLARAIPEAIRLPGPQDLRVANAKLAASEARFRAAADRRGHGFVLWWAVVPRWSPCSGARR